MKNHYETLELSESATAEEIKSSFRKLAMKWHPDKNGGSKEAEAKFKEINEAYSALSDPQKKAEYDNQRRYGQTRNNFNPNQGGYGFHSQHGPSFEDIIREMNRHRGGYQAYADARNRDIVVTYTITLEEAFTGKETDLTYNIPGKGSQTIKLKIPKGIDDGARIRFTGKGDDSMSHVAAGDLYVRIQLAPHPTFVRHGPHLAMLVSLDYIDAILGKSVEITLIDGETLKLKIPAGIHPGQSLRAQGKGMPFQVGGQEIRGDLMIELELTSPKLTDAQKKLLEKVRKA